MSVDMATRDQRYRVARLIDAKLSGQKRKDALGFMLSTKRKRADLDRLIARLETMPDADRPPVSALYSDEKIAAVRADRQLLGLTYKELAKKHGLSYGHVGAIVRGEKRVPR